MDLFFHEITHCEALLKHAQQSWQQEEKLALEKNVKQLTFWENDASQAFDFVVKHNHFPPELFSSLMEDGGDYSPLPEPQLPQGPFSSFSHRV